jgi:hypothetical protein
VSSKWPGNAYTPSVLLLGSNHSTQPIFLLDSMTPSTRAVAQPNICFGTQTSTPILSISTYYSEEFCSSLPDNVVVFPNSIK